MSVRPSVALAMAPVLARAPKLRLVVHAAGSVKRHVDAICFERGGDVAEIMTP